MTDDLPELAEARAALAEATALYRQYADRGEGMPADVKWQIDSLLVRANTLRSIAEAEERRVEKIRDEEWWRLWNERLDETKTETDERERRRLWRRLWDELRGTDR